MKYLRRCPFCGGDATFKKLGGFRTAFQYIAECERCGIHTREHSTEYAAAEKWNTRQEDNGIVLVEDGSVDLAECKELGLRPLVYRNGAPIPFVLKRRWKMTNEQAKELKRGDEVWYTDNDGECHEASVLSADGDHVIIRYIAWRGHREMPAGGDQ